MAMAELRLGEYRPSMATNPLLRKASLGKPMQRGFDLPGADFIYGRPNHCMDGGAQEAMQYCVLSEVRKRANDKEETNKPKVNYIKKNKVAVERGLVNAREQADGISNNEESFLIKPPAKTKSDSNVNAYNKWSQKGMTFGISTRPSTPVFELLEHRYQTTWLQKRHKNQRQLEEVQKKAKGRNGIKNTQANYQKQATITQKLKDNDTKQYKKDWQMNKWKKIESNLNTFRSEKVRESSMKYHYETMNTRQGIFGHGNYID